VQQAVALQLIQQTLLAQQLTLPPQAAPQAALQAVLQAALH